MKLDKVGAALMEDAAYQAAALVDRAFEDAIFAGWKIIVGVEEAIMRDNPLHSLASAVPGA